MMMHFLTHFWQFAVDGFFDLVNEQMNVSFSNFVGEINTLLGINILRIKPTITQSTIALGGAH